MPRLHIVLLFTAAFASSSCTRVDTYEAAVKMNAINGAVSESTFGQGLYHAVLRSWTVFDLREIQHPRGGAADILDVLTADQLRINVDAAFRWRVDPARVRDLYVQIGEPVEVEALVYNTYRSAVRDAVAEVSATNILSEQRAGLAPRIRTLMEDQLTPRGIVMTDFFLRGIDPPETIRVAVEEKLAREQQVAAEQYQTAVVTEQANQRRAEAEGIRDAQRIIAESLVGDRGRAYLAYEGLQALKAAAEGENNLIISPSEGGIPLMRPIP